MKVLNVKKFEDDESTQTLEILTGEAFEGTIVTEKLSIDKDSGDTIVHFTLETPSTEDMVYRTLEELAAETDEESVEIPILTLDEEAKLLDEITFEADPSDDALELELTDK